MRAGAFGLRTDWRSSSTPRVSALSTARPKYSRKRPIPSIHLQVPDNSGGRRGFLRRLAAQSGFSGFKAAEDGFRDPMLPPPESEASEASPTKKFTA